MGFFIGTLVGVWSGASSRLECFWAMMVCEMGRALVVLLSTFGIHSRSTTGCVWLGKQ